MKKFIGFFLIMLMLELNASACFAFPAAGTYESAERAAASDTGRILPDVPLWRLEINQSDDLYNGKLTMNAKGCWIGEWSAPLSITPNEEGRYVIEAMDSFARGHQGAAWIMELEETSDTSFNMYKVATKDGSKRFVASMNVTS